jgi:GNAT superfamily N-acetyltransferase
MSGRSRIVYAQEPGLDVAEFRRVLVESGLGTIRPVDDEGRLKTMLSAADIIVTARKDEPDRPLVGVARGIADFAWVCYHSEVAVTKAAQGLGVGRGLLDETRRLLGPEVAIALISVPDAVGFYERAGMARMPDAFWFSRDS